MNLQERTGNSQISQDFISELVSVSHRKMLPEYSAESTQGSIGCKSTHFTRSDRAESFFFISSRSGILARAVGVRRVLFQVVLYIF